MGDMKLNKEQKQAVEYTDGPLLIVAGAGTGKTTVVTKKIHHIVSNKLAEPENILALTFTEKAAEEMQLRVDALLDIGYVDLHVSTFHAFCQRVLERYGMDIGIPTTFKLMTEIDAWLLMREHLYEFELDYYRPLGNPNKHIKNFLKHFSKCKDELVSPQEYLDYAENVKLDKDAAQAGERDRLTEVANAYHKYNQLLLDNNALDFGDLIFYTHKLLSERPNILKSLQERFSYALVDEFQDVNYAQYELTKLLAENSQLTVVGDDDQSIYAFRGASVSNILRFKEDFPKAQEVVLTENYRSGQHILDLAYTSIQHNNPDRLEEKLKINKELKAKGKEKLGGTSHLHFKDLDAEVAGVVREIHKIKESDDSLGWDDFAILVRANNHAEPFLNAMEHAGMPYEFLASVGLYRQPVILDSVHFFRLVENIHETLSVYRLLRMPFFNVTESDVQKFTHGAKKKSISYYEGLKRAAELGVSKEGVVVCEKLLALIHHGIKRAKFEKPTIVLYDFLEQSGYLAYLTEQEEVGNRSIVRQIHQLKQFMDFVRNYETAIPEATVQSFVRHFNQILESGHDGQLQQLAETPDSVNVMTIHGSKGLEFSHVFVVNMVEDRFPTRRRGDALEVPAELIKEVLPEGDYHLQEERRLLYVAMTRAKRHLYFTSASDYGGVRKKKLSRFLVELGMGDEVIKSEDMRLEPIRVSDEVGKEDISYQLPKAFSFSQIRSFQTCKYQYKLAHVLKIPLKGSPYFSFGTTMHSTLQKFYEQVKVLNSAQQASLFGTPEKSKETDDGVAVPAKDELQSIYKASWIPDWYKSKNQREKYQKKGSDILDTYYKSNEERWTVPVVLEGWFKVRLGKYLVHGRIDRVDQLEDGTLEIIDYKTGKSKEKLTGADKDQLLMYQLATDMLPEYYHIGKTSKLTFYYLNDDIQTSFSAKPKDLEKLQEKIIKTLDDLHTTDFSKIGKKDMCGRCDFCEMAGAKPV